MNNKNKTILLIEDEADLLEILKFRLRANGYGVITASNGIEGLEKINRIRPDLIILDINLPGMGGIEFYNKICTPHGHSKYPVLVLTSRTDLEKTFKDIEADGFIAKPFEIDKLMAEIDRIIKASPRQVIFLIDYEESLRAKEIAAHLKNERYAVFTIGDFTLLQEKAREGKPDYIIMEYMQKEMSGESFIKKIKEDPCLCGIPVIVYSYSGFIEFEKKSLAAGADRYLSKPENYEVFITVIKELQIEGGI